MRATAALLALACLALPGCEKPPTEPLRDELVFERADGSRVQFSGTPRVWCGVWEEGVVGAQTLHVRLGSAAGPRWELRAVIPQVYTGQPIAFPNTFVWDDPRGAEIFVLDAPNELSTGTPGSSGSITFERLDCAGTGGVRFRIDAVIGSEFGDGAPIAASGTFGAPITGRP
ncbi:MAG TPA: hypothetical protein VHG51_17280 [Longimicrobiaceae bacterium]|nr:hypothetical protein [Longimicrobiaceae bacterium]